MKVAPAAGALLFSETAAVQLEVDARFLAAGTHSVTITVRAPGAAGEPQTVAVDCEVNARAAALSIHPTALLLRSSPGETVRAIVTLSNSTGSPVEWKAQTDVRGANLSPNSGSLAAQSSVEIECSLRAGRSKSTQSGTIRFAANDGSVSPVTVSVTLSVTTPPAPVRRPRARAPAAPPEEPPARGFLLLGLSGGFGVSFEFPKSDLTEMGWDNSILEAGIYDHAGSSRAGNHTTFFLGIRSIIDSSVHWRSYYGLGLGMNRRRDEDEGIDEQSMPGYLRLGVYYRDSGDTFYAGGDLGAFFGSDSTGEWRDAYIALLFGVRW